jgi:arginase family enzyme
MSKPALPPVVLDLDRAVRPLPGEHRLALAGWQERLRFGCGLGALRSFAATLERDLPPFAAHGTVFLGSGDFHHLSWPLVARCIAARAHQAAAPLRVVVLDNHPDNMRFPFGVHCGSWVRRVALLPAVAQVHVAGITSTDIGNGHAWENYLAPLRAGKLTYWQAGVDTGWARWLGVARAVRRFGDVAQLADALVTHLRTTPQPTYLSIDKDVFAPEVVHTNWDQGRMTAAQALRIVGALQGQVVGSDITGEVSSHRYTTAWKRWLSARDGQDTALPAQPLADWQAAQHALNVHLAAAIADART